MKENKVYIPLVPPTVLTKYIETKNNFITKRKSILLLTDISGFTKYTESLVGRKKENIENITKILNQHFETMDKEVSRYKGFLVRYAGDSMLAMFGGEKAQERAIEAGWRIIDSMEKLKKEEGLDIKVIIGGGEFYEMVLGDEEKREWAITGRVISEMASVEKQVEAGNVMVKKEIYQEKFPEIEEPPKITVEDVKVFYPASLERLPDTTFRGEYRIAATVFINIYGYDEENPQFEELNNFFIYIKNQAKKYGGIVNKIDIHHEGIKIMVVFGAPFAIAEEYLKAVEFARKIVHYKTSLKTKGTVGHGYVYAGFIGGDRKEYTIIGSSVNTSAKLLSFTANREIIISEELKKNLEDVYSFLKKGTFEVPGIEKKIWYYKLLDIKKEKKEKITESREKIINKILKEMGKKENKVFIIEGVRGTGKSFIADAIIQKYKGNWINIRGEEGIAYELFRKILETNAGIEIQDDKKKIQKKLNMHFLSLNLPPEFEKKIPFIETVIFGIEHPEFIITNYPPELIKENLKEAFRIYLTQLFYNSPFLLVVDDFHKMDKESIEIISHFLKGIELTKEKGITMLFTMLPEVNETWKGYSNVEIFRLPSFSKEEIKELGLFYFNKEPSEDFVEFLWGKTKGNPSYTIHMMEHILREHLFKIDEKVQLAETAKLQEIPETVYGLLMSKVDTLPLETKEILKIGAVYGLNFSLSIIKRITKKENIQSLLSFALKEGLILKFSNGDVEYLFAESMTREAVYNSLLLEERKKLHNQIAEEVEKMYKDTERFYPFLAHHFHQAEIWEKAFWYYYLAGKEDAKFYRNEQAVENLSRAIDIWNEKLENSEYRKEIYECYKTRGMVNLYLGNHQDTLNDFSKAISFAKENKMLKEEVDSLNRYADVLLEIRNKKGIDYATQALQKSKEIDYIKGIGDSFRVMGKYYFYIENSPQKSFEFFSKAMENYLRDPALKKELLSAYIDLAVNMRKLAQPHKAVKFFNKAKELAETTGVKHLELVTLRNMGHLYYDAGDINKAEELLQNALNIAMEIGHREESTKLITDLAKIKITQTKFKEAVELLQKAKENLQFLKSKRIEGEIEKGLGYVNFYTGNYNTALMHFKDAAKIFEEIDEPNELVDSMINISMIETVKEEFKKARTDVEKTLEIAKRLNNPFIEAQALNILSTIQLHYGDFENAYSSAEQSVEIRKKLNDPWGTAESLLTLIDVCWQMEQWEKGIGYCNETVEIARTQNPLMVCDAMNVKGRILIDAGDYEQAERVLSTTLKIAEQTKSIEHLFKVQYSIGKLYLEQKRIEKVLEILPNLYSANQSLKSYNIDFQTRMISAEIHIIQNNPNASIEVLKPPDEWEKDKLSFINLIEGWLLYTKALLEKRNLELVEECIVKLKNIIKGKNLLYKTALMLLLEYNTQKYKLENKAKFVRFIISMINPSVKRIYKTLQEVIKKKADELKELKPFYLKKWGAIRFIDEN